MTKLETKQRNMIAMIVLLAGLIVGFSAAFGGVGLNIAIGLGSIVTLVVAPIAIGQWMQDQHWLDA